MVTDIPMEGTKFFRDKKLSMSMVNDFIKSPEEKKELVKCETYYEIESIKRL